MAEAYNPPVAGPNQPAEDNEQRIDGDGQEVNALRFMGLGAAGAPVPPPPAITPVATGVSQPVQPPQQQPAPPQTPLQPPQVPQHQQPMPAPAGYDFPDPAAYGSMQIPPGPMSNPYGMPGQMPGVMGGGPMMMMPPYNYMYAHQPFYMPGPFQTMPSAPSSKSHLVAYLNVLRVQQPKVYRDWHKKYTAHMRNPERIPFPDVPGYVKGHGGQPQSLPHFGRQRKESTRSSVNGDPYRPGHGESFADFGGANSSMSHVYQRGHDRHRPSHSGRASVNGDYRHHPEDEFEIDGADISMLSGTGGHSLINTSHYPPSERDRPSNQSGRSSTIGDYNRPEEVYGGFMNQQPDSFSSNYDTSGRYPSDVREPSPKRTTPLKFSTFNWIAVTSPLGHLIRIKHGTVMEFVKLKQFVGHLPEYKEMESFPGPLTRVTHKHTVLQFCKRKIKEAQSNSAQIDRDNFILIWKFLMLMIKQNGHVVGTDIAELLMTAVEEEKKVIVVEETRDDVEGREDEEIIEDAPAPVEPTPPPVVEPKDEEKLVQQFCEHLLYGHKKDALDFAMDNGLWGHALFFASKMDDRLNGNVLARFANGIPMNSPLQTLYHIICGKQPASVTSCADESFGDWRPHLAMLLSNSGKFPQVEYKAIVTLGDTLASRNHLYAAQFCYLMAREEFRQGSRIGPLLGYSPVAKNLLEATQMTEVYDFALKLHADNPPLGLSFLESKLDYAKSLVNLGFVQEALAYCEEITKTLDIKRKLDCREMTLCANTLQIAERIALAEESSDQDNTSGAWIEDLKKLVADPSDFDKNSRKLCTHSSQEQSSEVTYTSQPQQIVSNETYDPTSYNQQHLPPDIGIGSVSQNQYDTGVPGVAINNNSNVPENTLISGPSNVQENNWSNPTQMNGGFHITQPMYDVTQQLSQMTLTTNTTDSTDPYSNNADGNNYPSYDGGYASTGGYDKQPNVAMNNNNYYYNQNQPYDPQPAVGMHDNIAPYKEQEYNHTSAIKKKSVRFEDEHERHADVENSIGNGVSVLRSRAPVRPDTLDLKSAMKSTIERHEAGNRRSNYMNGSIDTTDSKKSSDDSSSPDKSLFEVEYKSTYPIDEPIESVSRLNTSSSSSNSNSNSKLRPAPSSSSSYEYHNTFPVDRECCDVDEPCEDHDDYLGDDSENGVPDYNSKCTGYEKTELARNTLPPQGSGNKRGDEANKKGKENKGQGLDNNQQQQPGWFSGLFKFSLKPKNQMKLPDDKNPTIVWDANKKIWVNTASDGEEDSAPAGPPPKDSDLMRGPMPNGPMSMPPPNRNMQSVPPSANNMQTSQPNMSYQQAPAALHSLPNQMPTMNQPSQNPGMLNVPQQQPQLSNNSEPMIPGMPPVSNNSMNKYKLQKGRSLKNSYVDVLNPNSSPRSPSEPPQLPINNVSAPQVPNLFIPPPTNSSGDGPVSFLTAPSEEGPPGQDNSQVQAPPMFNPAQFQNPGYPQGQ